MTRVTLTLCVLSFIIYPSFGSIPWTCIVFTVHRALLPGPGSCFLYHSHSGFTSMAQASYPHYPVSFRIHLLGVGFVFNTYSQLDLATGYPGNTTFGSD